MHSRAPADTTLQSNVENSFLGKIEFELCENLKASRLARDRAPSNRSNAREGGDSIMRLRDKGKKEMELKARGKLFFERLASKGN